MKFDLHIPVEFTEHSVDVRMTYGGVNITFKYKANIDQPMRVWKFLLEHEEIKNQLAIIVADWAAKNWDKILDIESKQARLKGPYTSNRLYVHNRGTRKTVIYNLSLPYPARPFTVEELK